MQDKEKYWKHTHPQGKRDQRSPQLSEKKNNAEKRNNAGERYAQNNRVERSRIIPVHAADTRGMCTKHPGGRTWYALVRYSPYSPRTPLNHWASPLHRRTLHCEVYLYLRRLAPIVFFLYLRQQYAAREPCPGAAPYNQHLQRPKLLYEFAAPHSAQQGHMVLEVKENEALFISSFVLRPKSS